MTVSQPGVVGSLPLNEAAAGAHGLLRVLAGPGPLLHLAPPAALFEGCAGRPASWWPLPSYPEELLAAPTWTPRTMCGLRWSAMATHAAEIDLATDDDEFHRSVAYVCPECAYYALTELP